MNMPSVDDFFQAKDLQAIKKLLEENANAIKNMEDRLQKINNYMKWQYIFAIFKIVVIVIPLVLGVIFLPPLLKNVIMPYQELLESDSGVNDLTENLNKAAAEKNINVNDLIKNLSK